MSRTNRLRAIRKPIYPETREYPDTAGPDVTFNPIQQEEQDATERELSPLEAAGGTDVWGIVPDA